MKTLAQNWLLILLFVILFSIGAAIYAKINKAKKEAEIKQIKDILERGVGVDGTDIKTLTITTKPDTKYNAAADSKTIWDAKGIFNDDEQAVYNVFTGKTKAQIAQLYQTFLTTYKRDLDEYLKSFLTEETEYSIVLRLVNQAA